MRIEDVLRHKGTAVATVTSEATVGELLSALATNGVGALVVSADGQALEGIVSERDVVRQLHERGVDLLDHPVAEIMTVEVRTCAPEDTVHDVMRLMTEHRVRHIPVVVRGSLAGLVSIGDLVRHRIDELETERQQLENYISS